MNNTANELKALWTEYRADDATDMFVFAYTDESKPKDSSPVYFSLVPADNAADYLKADKKSSSHGGGSVLRFKPTNTQKADMSNRFGRMFLAHFVELDEVLEYLCYTVNVNSRALNRGHAVEYLLCERWGITWEFDNASHTVCGDITRNGTEYQVKFQGASL